MCLAIPGKVITVGERTCMVEIMGVTREASIELISDVKVGEYVLLHAGCAIQKLDEQEALATIQLFEELKDITNG